MKLKAHANNVALPHTIFSLPFALASSFMAANGQPDFWTVILILVAITSARWAAIAIDNIADLKYDKLQPRLSYRAMVRGEISKGEALIFVALCMVVLIVTVAQLPPICLKLLPVAAIPFIIYPFTKRFTAWCHLCLGVAIAMAPAGAWVALTESISLPMIILCVAVALWIGAFDAVYGAQDEKFDKSQRLHSLATKYGAAGALNITWTLSDINCSNSLSLLSSGLCSAWASFTSSAWRLRLSLWSINMLSFAQMIIAKSLKPTSCAMASFLSQFLSSLG